MNEEPKDIDMELNLLRAAVGDLVHQVSTLRAQLPALRSRIARLELVNEWRRDYAIKPPQMLAK